MRSVAVALLLWLGIVIELFAVLGVCVMRDVFDRLHYVSLVSYGALLVGLSILVRESFSLLGDKALLTGFVLVAVSPVLVHTTARSFRVRLSGQWGAEAADFGRVEGEK